MLTISPNRLFEFPVGGNHDVPKRKKVHPRELLGPLEAQVMAAVWRHPGLSGIEATTLVNDKRDTPLSPRTILTVLRRLEAKGFLSHVVDGRAYRYTAVVPESDFVEWHARRCDHRSPQALRRRRRHLRSPRGPVGRPRRPCPPRRASRALPWA